MSGESQKLLELAERCENAKGESREIDADIDVICRVGVPTMPEWVWKNFPIWRSKGEGRVEVEYSDGKGGVHWASRRFTASLDAALTLVPEGWYWRCGKTTSFQAWAVVNRTHPDHCEPNRDEFFANREHWQPKWTPVLALVAAALRARAAL